MVTRPSAETLKFDDDINDAGSIASVDDDILYDVPILKASSLIFNPPITLSSLPDAKITLKLPEPSPANLAPPELDIYAFEGVPVSPVVPAGTNISLADSAALIVVSPPIIKPPSGFK